MSEPDRPQNADGASPLVIPQNLDGVRLDKALVLLAGVSRSGAKALLESGVRVNGRRAVKGAVVHAGDAVTIERPDEESGDTAAIADPDVTLDVRLENEDVVVLHKPPRLATAPLRAGERGTLANGVVAKYPETAKVGPDPREPGLLHRLDNDTSGLVLIARNARAYDELKNALRDGKVDKRYLVIVAQGKSGRASSVAATGELADSGVIDLPLAPHPKDKRRVFACVHERDLARLKPRDAETKYKVLKRWTTPEGEKRALVEASASKALRHQVRVHFAALGAPLVGDGLYGGPAAPALGRHALHASRVSYDGGAHVKGFVVSAALPEDMQALVPEAP